jgi:predicted RND superfamily exporter protein
MAESPVPAGGWPKEIQNLAIEPVSWVSLTKEVADLAGKDFILLGVAMLGAIVLLCALAQRSAVLLGLNLLALVLAFCLFVGLLLLTGAILTPLSLISVPLLIGLAIDYSLHILMALEHEQGDLHRTYDHLAAPVLLTGLSASIGFGVPMLTSQPALQNFGLVMDLGVIASVVACLVFLPCVYMLCRPARRA